MKQPTLEQWQAMFPGAAITGQEVAKLIVELSDTVEQDQDEEDFEGDPIIRGVRTIGALWCYVSTVAAGSEAVEHVLSAIQVYGHHSLTSCPPNTRQMCPYHDELAVR